MPSSFFSHSSRSSSGSDDPPATISAVDPLCAERRRSNQLEEELRKARSQVLNLRKERLMELLFSEAEGRVGGDERGTFFDTFVTLCGGH